MIEARNTFDLNQIFLNLDWQIKTETIRECDL